MSPSACFARTRSPRLVVASMAALTLVAASCDTNAPDSPGDRFDPDGESPLITDPAGVGNQITNDEIDDDEGVGGDGDGLGEP